MARILLIEDELHIAEAIAFVLLRGGFEVATHPEGLGAIEAVRREAPDVVILDMMLPGRTGLEVLAALRADPALADLPVLMLTAKGQDRERAAAERAGATRFMAKPFANAEMLAAVRDLAPNDPQGA